MKKTYTDRNKVIKLVKSRSGANYERRADGSLYRIFPLKESFTNKKGLRSLLRYIKRSLYIGSLANPSK